MVMKQEHLINKLKNNVERFDEDFRFQLTNEEFNTINLMCKNFTSSSNYSNDPLMSKFLISKRGGTRKLPYAFTEQGIYMLMTVLRGELAIKQSKALVRIFKQMKDFIIQSQNVLSTPELVKLSLQTIENTKLYQRIIRDLQKNSVLVL